MNEPMKATPLNGLLETDLGVFGLHWRDGLLTRIELRPRMQRDQAPVPAWISEPILAYCRDATHVPCVPLAPVGTRFQQGVWAGIAAIPSGETRTYGQLATLLQSSARAVGQACRANPYPLVVPCHRVVGAQGVGGFAGAEEGPEVALKRMLLAHERR